MKQDRTDWLNERRKGIGGSDVAAVLGLNPWRTPLDVYKDKVGESDKKVSDEEAVHFGTILEDLVAKEFQSRTGMKIQKVNHQFSDKENPWMIANIDRAIINIDIAKRVWPLIDPTADEIEKYGDRPLTTDIALECKTCNAFKANQWSPSQEEDIKKGLVLADDHEIPIYYETQIQWYCGVLKLRGMYLAVLIGGCDYRIYWVPFNPEVFEILKQKCSEFWNEHVLKRVPPDPATTEDVVAMFPQSNGLSIEADQEMVLAYGEYSRINGEIKNLTRQLEEYKQKLTTGMKDNEVLTVAGEKVLTFKTQSRRTLDTKSIKEEDPDLYQELQDNYYKESTIRVLRLCA